MAVMLVETMRASRLRGLGAAGLAVFITGCSRADIPLLNPVGDVGKHEADLFYASVAVMAAIAIPVMLLSLYFAWRYRANGPSDDYDPSFYNSKKIEKITLFIPLFTIAILGALTWVYTHRLDPYEPRGAAENERPYEIQAISLNYKWLFVYPEENIATINEMVAPTGRPVTIRITSDPMMTAIFIPGLISQIYAMPGMETRANFLANDTAVLQGSNAMYSGPGFEYQRFKAHMVQPQEFDAWVQKVKSGADGKAQNVAMLDSAAYAKLLPNTKRNPITYYAAVEPGLFQAAVQKYMPEYTLKPLPSKAEYQGGIDLRKLKHNGMGANAGKAHGSGHTAADGPDEVQSYEAGDTAPPPEGGATPQQAGGN